jgi:predicted amidohydrolase
MIKSVEYQEKNRGYYNFRIALVFPELGKHDLSYFREQFAVVEYYPDLIVFPEAFETITPSNNTFTDVSPDKIHSNINVINIISNYQDLASRFKCGIIVGFAVKYNDSFISGSGNDQYCLYVDYNRNIYIYHKHSTSKYNAFFDSDWSTEKNLKVVNLKNKSIGISVCHDSYISLIPRLLKTKGADIWVNISYRNVRQNIWESIHLTRSVENNNISVCTLYRDSNEPNPQKEPYAFSPSGKIKLHDILTQQRIEEIHELKRTGRMYYFDCTSCETYTPSTIRPLEIAANAEPLYVSIANNRIQFTPENLSFVIFETDLKTFYSPESLWRICLDNINKTVIFIISIESEHVWNREINKIKSIIKGRTIEFSTCFIFVENCNFEKIFMAAYRSSNYKDTRVFYPDTYPLTIDRRYLKGLSSIWNISLNDARNKKNNNIYFKRISQILDEVS